MADTQRPGDAGQDKRAEHGDEKRVLPEHGGRAGPGHEPVGQGRGRVHEWREHPARVQPAGLVDRRRVEERARAGPVQLGVVVELRHRALHDGGEEQQGRGEHVSAAGAVPDRCRDGTG